MIGRWYRRLRTIGTRDRVKSEIARELDSHIAMETEHRRRHGMTADEAHRTALRDFGGLSRIREEVHDVRGLSWWDSWSHDVRFALRVLRRWPGYTAATVATLALGIGANTAIFSIVNDVLLEPLPYAESDRLVRIVQTRARPSAGEVGVSIPEFADYRVRLASVESLVEYHGMNFVLLDQREPDRVATGVVSSSFFDLFGVQPLHGRAFVEADDEPGAEAVLVLSHGYWRTKFGADPSVVGRVVEMNDKAHTIVGVLPPIPQYPRENDVYMPTSACPFRAQAARGAAANRRAFGALSAFARLERAVAVETAGSEIGAVAASFARDNRQVYDPDVSQFSARAVGLEEELIQDARPILLTLLGTTILVLLIACANVANLSLARMARRERVVAVRLALGAGRGRLVRQLLTESCVMAFAGAALGLAVAWTSLDLLAAFVSRFTPRVIDPEIDGTVLIFATGLAMVTGLLIGIVPALSARPSLVSALKDGSAQAGEGAKPARLRSVLVVAQVTVCFALLVGAGLLLDSLRRLASVDLGYRTDSVLTAEIFSNWSRTVTGDDQRRLYTIILDRLRSTPGVMSAAVTNAIPLSNLAPGERPIRIEGMPDGDGQQLPVADQRVASDGYFETLGVAPLRGRLFGFQDHQDAPPVAIVNQSMAALWGDRDPVGGRFRPADGDGEWITVIGVVGDLRQFDLDREAPAQYYTPFQQTPGIGVRVLLRTIGEPISFLPALKDAVRAGDPTIAVENVQTLRALYADRLASPGLNAALLAIFASVALVITLTGLAGVIGTAVTQRTREFGVRMALGATPSSILRMVLRQGLTLVLIGLAAGTAGALLLGQAVHAYLYQTRPGDPLVYLAVGGLFVATAIVACLAPARRATTIDPLKALKAE